MKTFSKYILILALALFSVGAFAQSTVRADIKTKLPWTGYSDTTLYFNWNVGEMDASWMVRIKIRANADTVYTIPRVSILPEDNTDYVLYPGLDTATTTDATAGWSYDDITITGTDFGIAVTITDTAAIKIISAIKYHIPKELKVK